MLLYTGEKDYIYFLFSTKNWENINTIYQWYCYIRILNLTL